MGNSTQLHQQQEIFQSSLLPQGTISKNEFTVIPARSHDPYIVALASEANRIAKRMWTRTTWEQRGSILRRFIEFTVRHNLDTTEENIPLFIVSLQLAKSSAIQYTRTLLTLLATARTPTQMFLMGLQKTAAQDPLKQARPMLRWELDMIIATLPKERDQVALRLAWVTASRWGEIAQLQKQNFVQHEQDPNAIIVDWGALPKTFKSDPHRAARYVVIQGADAQRVRETIKGMTSDEKLTSLTTKDMERILQPYGMTAHSIKRGALAHAAAAVVEHDLDPRLLTQLGKHADPMELPRSTVRYLGHWAATLNKSAHLTSLM
ncbi:trans-sialidase [Trypanosoma theileri]|uniref:Trans-sialidase n=1 Tax=Trypanosoma theileri TaxID=67003 RepID=A0A1X0P8P6_9TRYP|nr:trans-sialidase [Trypanosoma theileri]ORC93292.1 trans-sialidase [Trypanosoma theileri]